MLSEPSSRSPFQVTADNIEALLSQTTASSSDAKNLVSKILRAPLLAETLQALVRDNYRCILSGKVDTNSRVHGLTTRAAGERVDGTQLGHIFSQSMTEHIAGLTDAVQRKVRLFSPDVPLYFHLISICLSAEMGSYRFCRCGAIYRDFGCRRAQSK